MNTMRYIAKCKGCNCFTSALSEGWDARKQNPGAGIVYTNKMGFIVIQCRKCSGERYAKIVQGKFSAKHECSAKCLSSHGPTCECSCGGKNHGAAYEAAS